ncbi:hypothetical protein O181_020897, partial [Austropuccinia psidii MF-1]|nr:hypothetical protein [Austropuccinia psidii MF-1]
MSLIAPEVISLNETEDCEEHLKNSLRQEIIDGLTQQQVLIPGLAPEDQSYRYRKTLPAIVLYDSLGLELYDRVTSIDDYYPFQTELGILQANGVEIARRLCGLGSKKNPSENLIFPDSNFFHQQERSTDGNPSNGFLSMNFEGTPIKTVSLGIKKKSQRFPLSIMELGAGSLQKTSHLLRSVAQILEKSQKPYEVEAISKAEYYALDLDYGQLEATLTAIQKQKDSGAGPKVGEQVQVRGVCGTYVQGLEWFSNEFTSAQIKRANGFHKAPNQHRKAILWLGSSIGNCSPDEAVVFLRDQLCSVLDSETLVLIGIDNCKIPDKVHRAYDDKEGVTRQFILNGINVVSRQLGLADGSLSPQQFEYVSRYNIGLSRNEAYLRARKEIVISIPSFQGMSTEVKSTVIRIEAGELLMIEKSCKFSTDEAYDMFHQAGLRVIQSWSDRPNTVGSEHVKKWMPTHTLYLLEKPSFTFIQSARDLAQKIDLPVLENLTHEPQCQVFHQFRETCVQDKSFSTQEQLNSINSHEENGIRANFIGNIPSISEWNALWRAWDNVTLGMVPRYMLHHKPIYLRHIFLFYLGHVPVFADIHLSRYLSEPNTEPIWFAEIFERGIDPSIKDPTNCHPHSQVPESSKEWPSLEEILLFRDAFRKRLINLYENLGKNFPKTALSRRLARTLSMIYEHEGMHLETFIYMLQQTSNLNSPPGFTAPDWQSLSLKWDLETEEIASTELAEYATPETLEIGHDDFEEEDFFIPFDDNHEFGWDIESPLREVSVAPFRIEILPISNKDYLYFLLKTYPGRQPIPTVAIPASWQYKFLPALNEEQHQIKIKTVYGSINFEFAKHWPLQASGRQLETYARSKGGRLPQANELRVFMLDNPIEKASQHPVGFKHWHPIPPKKPSKAGNGRYQGGHNGGIWEWTSTTLKPHENFKSSTLYPGYSSDFFDEEHYIILGGSWATIPRIAYRKSFINWYQFD